MEQQKETRNQARNRQRLTAKIKAWLNTYKPLFLTMTWNDETLARTTEKERERLAIQYLRNETALYIANKDYGKKGNREHYHAVIVASTLSDREAKPYESIKDFINFLPWQQYGQITADFIGKKWKPKGDKGNKKTADNLARHFRKETTKGSRLIVSRGLPTKAEQLNRLERLKASRQTRASLEPLTEEEILADALANFNEYLASDEAEQDREILSGIAKNNKPTDEDLKAYYFKIINKA